MRTSWLFAFGLAAVFSLPTAASAARKGADDQPFLKQTKFAVRLSRFLNARVPTLPTTIRHFAKEVVRLGEAAAERSGAIHDGDREPIEYPKGVHKLLLQTRDADLILRAEYESNGIVRGSQPRPGHAVQAFTLERPAGRKSKVIETAAIEVWTPARGPNGEYGDTRWNTGVGAISTNWSQIDKAGHKKFISRQAYALRGGWLLNTHSGETGGRQRVRYTLYRADGVTMALTNARGRQLQESLDITIGNGASE